MVPIIIRSCKVEDIKEVLTLQSKWVNENITHGYTADEDSHLLSLLGDYFIVAELDNKIIGYAFGQSHEAKNMAIFEDGETYFEIDDIYVQEVYRTSGVGSLLLDKILHKAKKNGVNRSLIYSATKDLDSVMKFYKKHDFKTWYVQMYQ